MLVLWYRWYSILLCVYQSVLTIIMRAIKKRHTMLTPVSWAIIVHGPAEYTSSLAGHAGWALNCKYTFTYTHTGRGYGGIIFYTPTLSPMCCFANHVIWAYSTHHWYSHLKWDDPFYCLGAIEREREKGKERQENRKKERKKEGERGGEAVIWSCKQ